MTKITLKIIALVALTWNFGSSAFAQSLPGTDDLALKAAQKSILENELKTCLLPQEYLQLKRQVQPYLQQMPNAIGYLNNLSQKRCEVVMIRALNFGMTREEIDATMQERNRERTNEFPKPKKLYEQKTLDEGGAHTG